MRRCWLGFLLFLALPASAAIPPGVTVRQLPGGVVLYERPSKPQQLPSFWDSFFSLFRLPKNNDVPLPFRRSVALLVGIGNYAYITPRLEYTSRDIEKMRDYLLTDGGFDAVYVMGEDTTPRLLESYMLDADKFRKTLGKEDRLLFYFSGHGADAGGKHPYLQFKNARPGEWSHDVLRVDEFDVWSSSLPASHVLFIFDACFAGEAVDPKAGNEDARSSIAELSANGSRIVVTAGTAEQKAWVLQESSKSGYSLFTDALVRALREGSADPKNRGFVTIEQAVAEAQVQLAAITKRLGPGHEMKPHPLPFDPARKGTFVFLNAKAQKPSLPEGDAVYFGPAIDKGANPDLEKELELALWKSVEHSNDTDQLVLVCKRFPNGYFCPVAQKMIGQLKMASSDLGKMTLSELEQLAADGTAAALTQLGKAYENGTQGAGKDLNAAIGYYSRAGEKGDGKAAYMLGEIYYYGRSGIAQDFSEARRWYEKADQFNDADAPCMLGMMYLLGVGGLQKDERKAVELFQKSTDLGSSIGMANLGTMYTKGRGGLPNDQHKAFELYTKSTDLGNSYGMVNLGIMYRDGRGGLTKDERKAAELYQKSADLGNSTGMAYLGTIYQRGGGGLPQDERKAVELYRKASDLGDRVGLAGLANMYEQGRGGLPKDIPRAIALYRQSADLGNEWASEQLKRLNVR